MSGQYRRGGSGAPKSPRPGRPATRDELDFNDRVKAESENPIRQYVQFLEKTLDAKSGEPWNLFTLVMALNWFGRKCGGRPYKGSPTLLLERFAERLARNTEDFNAQQVGNAFFGLQGINTATLEPAGLAALTRVLNVLADKAGTCTENLNGQAVANAFYGLKGIDTATLDRDGLAALTKVLDVLADKAGTCTVLTAEGGSFTENLKAEGVGMAFYGLQGIDTATLDPAGLAALTKVLNVLADMAGTCTENLNGQAVAMAFHGLRGIDTHSLDKQGRDALSQALEVLAHVSQKPKGWITSAELGEASEGLQGVNPADLNESGRKAIADIIALFAFLCKNNTDGKRLNDVMKVVGTLQAVDTTLLDESGKERVTEALEILADVIHKLPEPLSAQGISMAFGSLARIGTGDLSQRGRRALVNVVKVLSDRARPCREQLRDDGVGKSLGGLRGIDPSDLESGRHDYGRRVLADAVQVLTDKSKSPPQPLRPGDLSSAMMGLWPTFTHPDTRQAGITSARQCLSGLDKQLTLDHSAVRGLASVLRSSFCVASELGPEIPHIWNKVDEFWISQADSVSANAEKEVLLAMIESEQAYALYNRPMPQGVEAVFTQHSTQARKLYEPNETEDRVRNLLAAKLGVHVLGNQLVRGFELDVVFLFNGTTYNIELDGPHHALLTNRLKDQQRDNYLRSAGHHVIRKNVLTAVRPEDIVAEIINEIGSQGTESPGHQTGGACSENC